MLIYFGKTQRGLRDKPGVEIVHGGPSSTYLEGDALASEAASKQE